MLTLWVSPSACVPSLKPVAKQVIPAAAGRCAACGAPGGVGNAFLQDHTQGKKVVKLCPICHCCLHLDFAGRVKAGAIIWLPEIAQEQLNILCLAIFLAARKAAVLRNDKDASGIVQYAIKLYNELGRRTATVEEFFVDKGAKPNSLGDLRKACIQPAFLASLISSAKTTQGIDVKSLPSKLGGFRLLPEPQPFEPYIDSVSRSFGKDFPLKQWLSLIAAPQPQEQEAADASA